MWWMRSITSAFIFRDSSSMSVSYEVYSCSRVARLAFSCASAWLGYGLGLGWVGSGSGSDYRANPTPNPNRRRHGLLAVWVGVGLP